MSVLVTVGAVYVGSQAVLELTNAGETVIVLDTLSIGLEAAVSPGIDDERGPFDSPCRHARQA